MADKGQMKWRWNNTKLILMFSLISKSCLSFFYIKKVFLKYQFIQQIHDTYIKGSLMLCRTKIFPGAGFSWLRLRKSIWTALLAQWPTVLAPRFLPPRTMTLILWEWGCKSLTFLAQCFPPAFSSDRAGSWGCYFTSQSLRALLACHCFFFSCTFKIVLPNFQSLSLSSGL